MQYCKYDIAICRLHCPAYKLAWSLPLNELDSWSATTETTAGKIISPLSASSAAAVLTPLIVTRELLWQTNQNGWEVLKKSSENVNRSIFKSTASVICWERLFDTAESSRSTNKLTFSMSLLSFKMLFECFQLNKQPHKLKCSFALQYVDKIWGTCT